MIILGLNINHADTSACLIVNGEIISAIEEERFVRIKHYAGLPINSIEFCLQQSKLRLKDVNFITVNYSPSANFKQKIFYSFKNILSKNTFKKILYFMNKLFHTSDLGK
jgi:carbamoyltransferase